MRTPLLLAALLLEGAAGVDEIIDDPELAGTAPPPVATTLARPQGTLAVTASTRLAVDTSWEGSRTSTRANPAQEDVAEWRTRLDLELGEPLGGTARVFVAGRLEHIARARAPELPEHVRGVFEARLLDAYLDARLGVLDVRVGNQIIPWGRVDVFSAGDFWNPPDLREGLLAAEALPVVPVPALRVDARAGQAVGLSVAYQPFFIPMRADLFGSDTALLGSGAPAALDHLAPRIRALVDPSTAEHLQAPLLATELPEENLSSGQVGARATLSLGEGEIAASAFYGYEKIPTLWLSPEVRAALLADPDDVTAWLPVLSALESGARVLSSRYERYGVLVLDGEVPAGDLLVKWEVGLTPARTLYRTDATGCQAPCALRRGLVQGAVHVERVTASWLVQVEAFVAAATRGAPAGSALLYFGRGRTALGTAAVLRWSSGDGDLELTARVLALWPGPGLTLAPQASLRLTDMIRLEAGAVWAEATRSSALASADPDDLVWTGAQLRF